MADHLIDAGVLTRAQAGRDAYKGYKDAGARPLDAFRFDCSDGDREAARREFGIEYPAKPPADIF